jgi:transposase-like protein
VRAAAATPSGSGETIKQIATNLGIAESRLRNWLRQADVEDGRKRRHDLGHAPRCAATSRPVFGSAVPTSGYLP